MQKRRGMCGLLLEEPHYCEMRQIPTATSVRELHGGPASTPTCIMEPRVSNLHQAQKQTARQTPREPPPLLSGPDRRLDVGTQRRQHRRRHVRRTVEWRVRQTKNPRHNTATRPRTTPGQRIRDKKWTWTSQRRLLQAGRHLHTSTQRTKSRPASAQCVATSVNPSELENDSDPTAHRRKMTIRLQST